MTDLLISADPHIFEGERITKTVYDQTMGTSQMLGCIEERLRQLDAVRRVLADVATNSTGKSYLIQHSTGSGKSNSIA